MHLNRLLLALQHSLSGTRASTGADLVTAAARDADKATLSNLTIALYVTEPPRVAPDGTRIGGSNSTGNVYARYLTAELERRGARVLLVACGSERKEGESKAKRARRLKHFRDADFPWCDHAISCEQEGFGRREPLFYERVRAVTRGLVCSISDHDDGKHGPEDPLFLARPPIEANGKSVHVGWAADPMIFYPEKDPDWFTIFVDHAYFIEPALDNTVEVLENATRFAAEIAAGPAGRLSDGRRVRVAFFGINGVELVEPGEVRSLPRHVVRPISTRVPLDEIAAWYRRADVFVVTHSEAMGLPVLESAMSGALVVARRGFVHPELLGPLHAYVYDGMPDWHQVVAMVDPARSVKQATPYRWEGVVDRIVDTLLHGPPSARPVAFPENAQLRGRRWWSRPAPPLNAATRSFPAGWTATRVVVTASPAAVGRRKSLSRIVAAPEDGYHYLRRRFAKPPRRDVVTVSFVVRAGGCRRFAVWLFGNSSGDRAEAQFDLASGTATMLAWGEGWAPLGVHLAPAGSGGRWLCSVSARSDWAVHAVVYLVLWDKTAVSFDPADRVVDLDVGPIAVDLGMPMLVERRRLHAALAADIVPLVIPFPDVFVPSTRMPSRIRNWWNRHRASAHKRGLARGS